MAIQTPRITEEVWQRIFALRDRFVEKYGDAGKPFYDYQREPSNRIIKSVLLGKGEHIAVEFARQSGKTEMVVDTVLFLHVFYHSLCRKLGLPAFKTFNTIIFAPQLEQAKTDFDRIKLALPKLERDFGLRSEEKNGNTIRLSNGTTAFCFTLSPGSHPESKTAHLIILEEAQDLLDERIDNTALPMGAATNATVVYIGTAGYRRCKLYDFDSAGKAIKVDYKRVIEEKRLRYEQTGDPLELAYEKHIQERINTLGIDSDAFKTQYALIWVLERGQFITLQQLEALKGDYEAGPSSEPCAIGIDFGKSYDSTVLTAVSTDYRILGWLELHGDDYNAQFELIKAFVRQYPYCFAVACDSTGTQDMMVDRLQAELRVPVIGVPFTPQNKDRLYKRLASVMLPRLGVNGEVIEEAKLRYPARGQGEYRNKFIKQMIDLQKDIKPGGLWNCHHPEGAGYHDDFPDSLALALEALEQATPMRPGKAIVYTD